MLAMLVLLLLGLFRLLASFFLVFLGLFLRLFQRFFGIFRSAAFSSAEASFGSEKIRSKNDSSGEITELLCSSSLPSFLFVLSS